MLGAIIGDIVGSPYEFHNIKRAVFPDEYAKVAYGLITPTLQDILDKFEALG